ncbi:MAG: hypothetical protein V3W44_04805, partial [Dehalococcoidales bacterium]
DMYHGLTPTPDPGFARKLREFDPKLRLEFSREHEKFIITQPTRLRSGRVPLILIGKYADGTYRQPDDRDLEILHGADMHRSGQEVKDRIRIGEEYMLQSQEDQFVKARAEIRDRAKDDKTYLMQQYNQAFNNSKANAAYRRVIPEAKKGFTVVDKRNTDP